MVTSPKYLLRDVYWSFAEPVPVSPEALVAAAEEYAESIEAASPALVLRSALPFAKARVKYQHAVQRAGGEWENEEQTLEVSSHSGRLTGATLLWELHLACQSTVANRDHHYFEGLELVEGPSHEPLYELCLGS